MADIASTGFPPVAQQNATVLILGSLPGRKSLAAQQYYAHPQNAFWPIMRELYGIEGEYELRCRQLAAQGIALWDVLHSSVRPGSMDADIRIDRANANDFGSFFAAHSALRRIVFNGRKAEQLFAHFVDASAVPQEILRIGLPSTSPAYAAMPFSRKLAAWHAALTME